MDTVGELILFVSRQLTDQRRNREFMRWNRKDLLIYLNQGLKEIAAYRAEAFCTKTTVQLEPGAVQKAPDGSTITSIATEKGVPVPQVDDEILKAYSTYATCARPARMVKGQLVYAPKSVAVDSTNKNVFYISPPFPAGLTMGMVITIEGKPPEYTFADWNKTIQMQDKYLNNLVDFMMARAYQMDTESAVSLSQARGLFQAFYSIMGVKYKMDSARGSGYYEGKVGDGDSRSIAK